jgi:PAS domain S-box-containing protein
MTVNTSAAALYRAILSSSLDGMAIVAGDTRFVEVNQAFCRLFESEPLQVAGKRCAELFGGQDGAVSLITSALQEHQPLAYCEVDWSAGGSARAIGLSVTPVQGSSSQALSLIIARDMTALRDVKQREARFLSLIAHELRAPLNTLHGYLDLALMGLAGDLNDQQREFVQRARASSEHLYALLEDLLLISRVDAAQLRLKREVTGLRALVSGALEELELTIADNAVTIDVSMPDDLPPLYVDAVRVQQVLRNLISNALRLSPAGGTIVLSAAIAAAGVTEPTLTADREAQRSLQLQVSDSGGGMDDAALPHVFERFGGQGLSLAIVKTIVEMHGGQVTVASTPGRGSTFTCLLPCLLS